MDWCLSCNIGINSDIIKSRRKEHTGSYSTGLGLAGYAVEGLAFEMSQRCPAKKMLIMTKGKILRTFVSSRENCIFFLKK